MRYSHSRNPITNAPIAVRPLGITGAIPATVAERRVMKNVATPEHAYTGCIPQCDEPEIDPVPVKRNPPILGYKGHLRNAEDRIGTTFTHGLEATAAAAAATRAAESVGRQYSHSRCHDESTQKHHLDKKERPPQQVRFQTPLSPQKQQAVKCLTGPERHESKPQMSGRSGYGAFDNASGYGEFAAPPVMSGRSGYGAFDNASGYGEFAAPPVMSGRSGYGAFDNASGYGEFAAPPPPANDSQSALPQRLPQRTEALYASPQTLRLPRSESLDKKYQQALKNVGGRANALKLWPTAASTIACRHRKRTELLQTIRRSFERREHENGGCMTREQLKEALQNLSCVFTDDQVTALFGLYDTQCSGTVPMDTLLLALIACL